VTTLLLASGGIDSTAIAAIWGPDRGLFIDYGQRSAFGERAAARFLFHELGIPLDEIIVDLSSVGSGVMRDGSAQLDVAPTPEWWPFRNQLLVTIAAGHAVNNGHLEVWIGLVKEDQTRHADGTRPFVDLLASLLAFQEGHIKLVAPAIDISAGELVTRCGVPPELLQRTFSCHSASVACGLCPGCQKRLGNLSPGT
jgi:7-cyano-7-deazaguanine synthase